MRISYVYMLLCSDNTYYTGITNDLDRRYSEHQDGTNRTAYTFSRRPVELVYFETFSEPDTAIAYEKKLKKWSQKKKKALIDNNWEKLKEFAACRNETSHLRQCSRLRFYVVKQILA